MLKIFNNTPTNPFLSYSFTKRYKSISKRDLSLPSVINGTQLAKQIKDDLLKYIQKNSKNRVQPGMAILAVGQKDDQLIYLKQQISVCTQLGIKCQPLIFPEDVREYTVLDSIKDLNFQKDCHGMIVQLPLPPHLNASQDRIINTISPLKDIDGQTDENISKLFLSSQEPYHIACTPAACLYILEQKGIDLSRKNCLIINQSRVVGLPLSPLLLKNGAILSNCNGDSPQLSEQVQQADIILSAIGRHDVIKSEWVKPGAIILDIGISVVEFEQGQKIVGDFDFHDTAKKAQLITPVPGGIGPLTVMMLMNNLVNSWARSLNIQPLNEGLLAQHISSF